MKGEDDIVRKMDEIDGRRIEKDWERLEDNMMKVNLIIKKEGIEVKEEVKDIVEKRIVKIVEILKRMFIDRMEKRGIKRKIKILKIGGRMWIEVGKKIVKKGMIEGVRIEENMGEEMKDIIGRNKGEIELMIGNKVKISMNDGNGIKMDEKMRDEEGVNEVDGGKIEVERKIKRNGNLVESGYEMIGIDEKKFKVERKELEIDRI